MRQLLRRSLTAACPRSLFVTRGGDAPAVCLTFDDGPHPEHTPRVLDVLAAHNVRATFFVVGREATRYPDIIRRIASDGHEIGHHSYHHGAPEQVSARDLIAEVARTERVLQQIAGCSARLVRPPHGKVTIAKLWRLWRHGYTVALWNVDPKDFACRSGEDLMRTLAVRGLHGGDIILLHDNHACAAQALPGVIAHAKGRGLEFWRVSQAVDGG